MINAMSSEVMEVCEPSNGSMYIRQLTGEGGFDRPPKSKTAKADKTKVETTPIATKNAFETLGKETSQAGCSKDSTPTTAYR